MYDVTHSYEYVYNILHSRLKSGNACYHSVRNLLSSSLLSRNVKIKIYRTIILPVVLHGREAWSFTLREEHRLRVFQSRVLRRIFGPKRDEVTGKWRRLHKNELYALYSLPNIIRVIKSRRLRWAGLVARMGRGEVHTGFVFFTSLQTDTGAHTASCRIGAVFTVGKAAGGVALTIHPHLVPR